MINNFARFLELVVALFFSCGAVIGTACICAWIEKKRKWALFFAVPFWMASMLWGMMCMIEKVGSSK